MAFESLINRLIPEGAVMAGNRPNVIEDGVLHDPGYQTDPLSMLNRGLSAFQAQEREKQETLIKRQEKKFDMYKTLRDSGYDPKRAFKAVEEGAFPSEPGDSTPDEKKKQAEIDKVKADTARVEALKERTVAETEKIREKKAPAPLSLKQKIEQKIVDGIDLTPGEQKVYDESIRKRGPESSIKTSGTGPKASSSKKENKADWVPMETDKGVKKRVHPDDVEKAIAKGWKKI